MKTTPKFRGKRFDNGEWVEGNLFVEHDGSCSIAYNNFNFKHTWKQVTVDSSTVEQIGGDVVDENKRLREALKSCVCELAYVCEQFNVKPGGSVARAFKAGKIALGEMK